MTSTEMQNETKVKSTQKSIRTQKKGSIAEKKNISIDMEAFEVLKNLLQEVKDKQTVGRNVTYNDVVKYALSLTKTSDVEKILNSCLTSRDKNLMVYEKHLNKTGENISFDDFIAMKLKVQ